MVVMLAAWMVELLVVRSAAWKAATLGGMKVEMKVGEKVGSRVCQRVDSLVVTTAAWLVLMWVDPKAAKLAGK